MRVRFLVLVLFLISLSAAGSEVVRIRLFSDTDPHLAIFTVVSREYELNTFTNGPFEIGPGEIIIVSQYGSKLFLKARDREGIACDSVLISETSSGASFSLRVNGVRRIYSGNLHCFRDLGSLLLVNSCDVESYVAGVVRAEGGAGKNAEYFKTQAVIARTYLYRYFDKHITDGFNLCDNTHCQVYNGITADTAIVRAALETKGQVILGPDSTLIIAAFHSNCGGETAASENVWLTHEPYLKKITDPFCTGSRNSSWRVSMSREEWTGYFEKAGYRGDRNNPALLNFSQRTRMTEFSAGEFSLPLRQIRADLNLRSSFFSISLSGDSVVINGRGYGHGVGLCQEGAMNMAMKGFDYRQIINFYYTGVFLADISEVVAEKD